MLAGVDWLALIKDSILDWTLTEPLKLLVFLSVLVPSRESKYATTIYAFFLGDDTKVYLASRFLL